MVGMQAVTCELHIESVRTGYYSGDGACATPLRSFIAGSSAIVYLQQEDYAKDCVWRERLFSILILNKTFLYYFIVLCSISIMIGWMLYQLSWTIALSWTNGLSLKNALSWINAMSWKVALLWMNALSRMNALSIMNALSLVNALSIRNELSLMNAISVMNALT